MKTKSRPCCPHAAGRGGEMCGRCAADRLCVSPRWLATRLACGDGPPVVRLGRFVRYLETDINQYVLAHRQENQCLSIATHAHATGGADSGCIDANIASQLADEIAERLRQKSADSEPSAKPIHHLQLVPEKP